MRAPSLLAVLLPPLLITATAVPAFAVPPRDPQPVTRSKARKTKGKTTPSPVVAPVAPVAEPTPELPPAPPPVEDRVTAEEPARPATGDVDPDLVRLSVGGGIIGRTFDYRDPLSPNLRSYSVPAASLVAASVVVMPVGSNEGGGVRVGAVGRYARSIGMSSGLPDGTTAATTYDRWEAGLRLERNAHRGSPLGTIGFLGSYSVTRFLFDGEQAAKILPEAGYGSIAGVGDIAFELPGFTLGLFAGGGWVPQTGVSGRRFKQATGGVARLGASATIPIVSHLAARLWGDYERFFLSMNPEPGDRFVAGGALDQYLRGGIDVLCQLLSRNDDAPRRFHRVARRVGLRRDARRSRTFRRPRAL